MLRYISSLPSLSLARQWPRALAVLGSTGSIGRSALAVARRHKERFRLAALAGGRNIALLAEQAAEFRPAYLGVLEEKAVPRLRSMLPADYRPEIVSGPAGYEILAGLPEVSLLLSAQSGAAGLKATYAGVEAGKCVALANKESLVLAGGLIRESCARSGASILPVDSEHNAIFQCLSGILPQSDHKPTDNPTKEIARLILTASGGPFYGATREYLAQVTKEQALRHPNWDMGAKITIDSATLMNKGLELIEAWHLYGLPLSRIEVLVHRESLIHSLVEFSDGSHLAQLGPPDMRMPIAYCLGWPERLESGAPRLDLRAVGTLSFAEPDLSVFPCLSLARQAQERGLGSPVVLNAANEEAVAAFLDGRIGFTGIAALVEQCLADYAGGKYSAHSAAQEPASIEAVLALDEEARVRARLLVL